MRVLKNRYVCEDAERLREVSDQLVLFEDKEDHRRYKKVKVVMVSPEENRVKVGDYLTIHATAGEKVALDGEKLLFVKKGEVIEFG